jgi:hypothetical protein
MKKIMMLLLLVVVCAATVSAQESSVVFHPGESVHILVTLKSPPATFDGVSFAFGILGQPDKKQELLGTSFQGSEFKKITDEQFEMTVTIPEHTASGTFRLSWINIAVKRVSKQYQEGSDFKVLTITILNPEHPEFPTIDDVRLAPRN